MSEEARRLLRKKMDERGLSQTKLAAIVGVRDATVCRWLDDERPAIPDARSMVSLELALGIPLSLWLTKEQKRQIKKISALSEPVK